ncbi:hypothetical protein D3C79_796050 [compost metagenome]
MHGLRGVFGDTQGLEPGQVKVHFRWRLSARGELEFDIDAGNTTRFIRLADQVGRWDQGDGAADGHRLADGRVDLPLLTTRQVQAELILGTAAHGIAGVDVLAHDVFHEPGRC